jgi:hypothetical protein
MTVDLAQAQQTRHDQQRGEQRPRRHNDDEPDWQSPIADRLRRRAHPTSSTCPDTPLRIRVATDRDFDDIVDEWAAQFLPASNPPSNW